jgi:hypothetical protein
MKRWIAGTTAAGMTSLALAASLFATGPKVRYGTQEEAQALVSKAIEAYRQGGAEKTFAQINRPGGPFRVRDLYVFVIGPDKKVVADASDPSHVGSDAALLRDSHGNPYGLMMFYKSTPDGAWVDADGLNPQTGRIEDKSWWVVKEDGYVFGCGAYSPPARDVEDDAAARAKWEGRWTVADAEGKPFSITLDPSGQVQGDRHEGDRGFWIVEKGIARIDWIDGWTDFLAPDKDGFLRSAFAPGASRDGDPTYTSSASREEPAPTASGTGSGPE